MTKFSSKQVFVTAVLMFLHGAVFFCLAPKLNIWLDEAWTFETTARTASEAFTRALQVERQAPLYFAVLAAWRGLFGHSLFIMRLFSVVCTLGTIAFLPSLARSYLPKIYENISDFALLAICVALHPYLIWASLEARVYALVIFLTVLLYYFFADAFLRVQVSRKARIYAQTTYFLLAAVSLYTNYFTGFVLFANFLALLVLRRWRNALIYGGQMILVGVIFVPVILTLREQFAANENYYREAAGVFEGIRNVFGFFISFALSASEHSKELLTARMWAFRMMFVVTAFFFARRMFKTKHLPFAFVYFGVIVATVSAFLLANYLALGLRYTQIRHAAPLFLACVFFVVTAVCYAFDSRGRKIFGAVFLVFAASALFFNYQTMTKNYDWRPVLQFIETHEKPSEPIYAFRVTNQVVIRANYRGINNVPPVDDRDEVWEERAAPNSVERYAPQIEHLISQISPETQRFWLISEDFCFAETAKNECLPLENYLKDNFRAVAEKDFNGVKARLLEKF